MKFSIDEIKLKASDGPFLFSGEVDVSEIETWNNDIIRIDSVFVEGMCTVDKDEFVFSYSIEGMMILPCARTLVEVPYSFKFQATEIFSSAPSLTDEEDEVHVITNDEIDLTPYIKQTIVLETPYRVFSDEKVIEEGDGWSFYEEDEFRKLQEAKVDPRLEKLKTLFDKKGLEK